jgi:hypothetical protein
MTREDAERKIRDMFSRIQSLSSGLRIPHGFELESVGASEEDDRFPAGSRHWEATAILKVPIVYSYTTLSGAQLPADSTNLKRLRAEIERDELEAAPRTRIREWIVEPDQAPEPGSEPADWTVTITFELR